MHFFDIMMFPANRLAVLVPSRLVAVLQMVAMALVFNLASGPATAGQQAAAKAPVRIVAYGDSLTAGFGLPSKAAFPAQLQSALTGKGLNVEVANAGVSGDTTASGLDRFDWSVPEGTDAVILELGANDALRGLPPEQARANLDKILAKLRARGIDVLLAGMGAPRNLGEPYVKAFDGMYPALAEKHGVALYPFFLDGVIMNPALNLDDGLHPNAKGVSEIVARILPHVEALVARVEARRQAAAKG